MMQTNNSSMDRAIEILTVWGLRIGLALSAILTIYILLIGS